MLLRPEIVETLVTTSRNPIETGACALALTGPGVSSLGFHQTGRAAVWRWCAVSNDGETGKKRECAAIMIVFRRNPDVV
jgi:hypothetical protein